MDKQTLRQILADYHDVSAEDVTQEMFDPAMKFLRENHDGPSETDIWVLDEEAQTNLTDYLKKRASGELIEEGEAESDPWDEYVDWAKRFYERSDFDANERAYKLAISDRINEARTSIEVEGEDWQQRLKRSFGAPNNITHYITHSRFLDWVAEEPAEARSAMLDLWDEEGDLIGRIDEFVSHLPHNIPTPGARLQLASYLLLVFPTKYPIYRASDINQAFELTEYPEVPIKPESVRYEGTIDFYDRFIEEAKQRGLDIRDRLDAQSLTWLIANAGPPSDWTGEAQEAFLRYRGDRPQVWWVNQGASYQNESTKGVVTAPTHNKAGITLQHHKNVSLLRKGDVIVHHAGGYIRAISVVSESPKFDPESDTDGRDRWVTRTAYYELGNPIEVREMDPDRRSTDAGAFDKYGGVKQVYLVPISVDFSDWLQEAYRERWPEGSPWAPKQRNTWLFQSKPDIWDLQTHLEDMEEGHEDDFRVVMFKTEYAVGDRVLMWTSGSQAGLYAIGEISGDLHERAPELDDESELVQAIPWMLTRKLDKPILRSDLIDHPILKGLTVITSPQGSNFRVTDEQWTELRRLIEETPIETQEPSERSLPEIGTYIANQGLVISDRTLRRFHVSIRTRGFVILSGISGTGKTWLSKAYAEATGAQYLLVPVAPNWTTNEDLLGYLNPLDNTYHDTVFSKFLRDAAEEYSSAVGAQRQPKSFILTLDEMNLSRVEYYFAKFLSAMEVRSREGVGKIELAANETVWLTRNLLFVGTVNVDETTHGFADKVFDRAQLIEMEAPREAIADHIGSAAFRDSLLDIYDAVEESKPFAFRVVDDVKDYVGESEGLDVDWQQAIDEQILQKVLPKFTGADPAVRLALDRILEICEEKRFELTRAKAKKMLETFDRDGFTSYF